jgi:hypothetical protein
MDTTVQLMALIEMARLEEAVSDEVEIRDLGRQLLKEGLMLEFDAKAAGGKIAGLAGNVRNDVGQMVQGVIQSGADPTKGVQDLLESLQPKATALADMISDERAQLLNDLSRGRRPKAA